MATQRSSPTRGSLEVGNGMTVTIVTLDTRLPCACTYNILRWNRLVNSCTDTEHLGEKELTISTPSCGRLGDSKTGLRIRHLQWKKTPHLVSFIKQKTIENLFWRVVHRDTVVVRRSVII